MSKYNQQLYRWIEYATLAANLLFKTKNLSNFLPGFYLTAKSAISPSRLNTLDVLGIGLCIEMFQRSQVWMELEKQSTGSILPPDLDAYPTDEPARKLATDKRSAEALAAALRPFVEHWPIPSISIWPSFRKSELADASSNDKVNFFAKVLDDLRKQAEMPTHQIASLGAFSADEPEEILERVFQFFEGYSDVPALLIFAIDGEITRKLVGDISRKKHWEDGPRRFDSMSEAIVALIFARRERVDALRPFAGTRATGIYEAGPVKPGFKPSKFLPTAWTAEQIDRFDALQAIAVIHRPIRVSYRKDKDGKAPLNAGQLARIIPPQQRQTAFKEGLDAALPAISGGKPICVFYDAGTGGASSNFVPLSLAVHTSLPELDLTIPEEGIDISARIGNVGACSPFVLWALAVLTAFKKEGATIAVNLRKREEATITVITPTEKQLPEKPVKIATPATPQVVLSVASRNVALGARLSSGDECTQTGMWKCNPPDAQAGDTHFITAGRTLPKVRVALNLSTWQKMRGEAAQENVAATFTLVSYDMPND